MASENQQASPPVQTQQQSSQRDAFVKHLEHASSVVQTWPVWKQQVLGGTAAQQVTSIKR